MRAAEAQSHRKELRRCKLKYEILARNELNAKLSEINAFLERRAKEQAEQDKYYLPSPLKYRYYLYSDHHLVVLRIF